MKKFSIILSLLTLLVLLVVKSVVAQGCLPNEWLCKGDDVFRPEIICCWERCLPMNPQPAPKCPTDMDEGQKDGTGHTGANRHYYFFDPELNEVIEVPPVLPAL